MGYYIEVPENLDKAKQLKQLYEAQVTGRPASVKDIPTGKTLICVVENGLFDAAAICYNDRELEAFSYLDGRRRTWMLMDEEKVLKLCPRVKQVLHNDSFSQYR